MSDDKMKIKVKFPLISYDMIEEAAELSGCSVKAFAANAILEAAMRTVQGMDDFTYGDLDNIELTEDEAKALLGLVDALEVEDDKDEEVVEEVVAEEKVEEAKDEVPAEEPKVEEVVEAQEEVKVEEPVVAPAPAAKPARKGKKRARK